jgi:hypothetical protein
MVRWEIVMTSAAQSKIFKFIITEEKM